MMLFFPDGSNYNENYYVQCAYVLRIFWKKSLFEHKKTVDFTNKRQFYHLLFEHNALMAYGLQ